MDFFPFGTVTARSYSRVVSSSRGEENGGELHARTLEQYGISERRACRLAGISRSGRQCRPATDRRAALRERIRELAREQQRFGYLRLTILLCREGWVINQKKGVSHLTRGAVCCFRASATESDCGGAPLGEQSGLNRPNQSWDMDFMQNSLADGRTTSHPHCHRAGTRQALTLELDTSIPGL